jgi:hypothetical protein
MPFEPSAGLEGFDEEDRLWWQRYRDAAARGATLEKEEIAGDGGADEAIRRTEDENMPRPGEEKAGGLEG